jgi:CheY-like chemotaxis protein
MSKRNRSILLLDDDYASMAPLKEILEAMYGFDVELSAAKEIMARLAVKRYDLLCVDVMILPKSINGNHREIENICFEGVHWQKTGLEFLRRLRRGDFSSGREHGTSLQVPVIVLSAVANDSLTEAAPTGATNIRHIEKPFDLGQLIATMVQMMEQPVL